MSVRLNHDDPRGICLFAPGAAGDPTRYRRLLQTVNEAGFVVVATEHDLIDGSTVTDDELRERVDALRAPLDAIGRPDLPVVVAGHSAGGWAALSLVGAVSRNRGGEPIDLPTEPRISRAVLIAPATAWFRDDEAVGDVRVPLTVMVGSRDTVTPPQTAEMLCRAPAPVDVHTYEGAGHFDFMWPLPDDQAPTPGLDREAFYTRFRADFVAALS